MGFEYSTSSTSEYELSDLKWNVRLLKEWQKKLIVDTPYQRQFVWNRGIQQYLIWCIIRGQDVPKFYFHARRDNDENLWDIVDGKQRIVSIWDFLDNKYPLSKDATPIEGHEVAGLRFNDLPLNLQRHFLNYKLDIKEIVTDDIVRVIDQFIALQKGKPLNGQEKRQASRTFTKEFVHRLGEHPFVPVARLSKTRFANYEAISRLLIWEYENQITDTSTGTIDKFYITHAYENWNMGDWTNIYNRMVRNFDHLYDMFNNSYEVLRRIVPFMVTYWLIREITADYVLPHNWQSTFLDWWLVFWHEQTELERKKEIPQWASQTHAGKINQERYQVFRSSFFANFPDIVRKDPRRAFSDDDRRILFLKAKGRCQWQEEDGTICDKALNDGEWDADHIQPHTSGGKTDIENGRILCKSRNRSNGNPNHICPFARERAS